MNTNKINNNTDTNTEEEQTKLKKRKQIEEEQYRLVISKEVNDALEKLVVRTNEGFEGGEVNKSDIANILLLNSAKKFGDDEIKEIRSLHFDEKRVLRSLLKKTGDEGDLPDLLKKYLREHFGVSEKTKKRSTN